MLLRYRLALTLILSAVAVAAPPVPKRSTDQLFTELKKSPPELYAFLLRMPKGGDLHNHLSGAIYAESFLDKAIEAPLCVSESLSLANEVNGKCAPTQSIGTELPRNQTLWNETIDSLSMRDFVPAPNVSGADHFFDSFGKFSAASHLDEGGQVAEVAGRAAAQNESYLELMALSGSGRTSELGKQAGLDENNFDATRQKLIDAGIEARADDLKSEVDAIEESRVRHLGCQSDHPQAGCGVMVRYVYQVLRESSKEQVFAQILAGFLLASRDPRVVAVNLVQREDGYHSMHDYALHMRMLAYVRKLYPKVHLTLHAGELANGMVPPEGLRFHIHDAVTIAGAERIGHGVDIPYETDALDTLRTMREKHIDVEINLTSNDVILGVKGVDHPFLMYRKYGVPVSLSTDDEGVSRSHLTVEYQRAALTYNLSYAELKQLVRNSIEYSFTTPAEKTQLRADLEKRFRVFESWAEANFR